MKPPRPNTEFSASIGYFVNEANATKRAKERALEAGATARAARLERVEKHHWNAVKALRRMDAQEASG